MSECSKFAPLKVSMGVCAYNNTYAMKDKETEVETEEGN